MNENIDLTKILKNCPKGFKLYSIVHGEVTFLAVEDGRYPICVLTENYNCTAYYSSNGKVYATCGKCVLFPSEKQQDWSKFTAPWYKKAKFDPKTLKPFDKVLSKYDGGCWSANLFSHIEEEDNKYYGTCSFVCNGSLVKFCIPYNDDTKHLVGTKDEAPDFYKYWED